MRTQGRAAACGELDPYKDDIIGRVQAAAPDWIPVVVVFREIGSRGYCGGETRLKEFVRGPGTGAARAAGGAV